MAATGAGAVPTPTSRVVSYDKIPAAAMSQLTTVARAHPSVVRYDICARLRLSYLTRVGGCRDPYAVARRGLRDPAGQARVAATHASSTPAAAPESIDVTAAATPVASRDASEPVSPA
ncbi:hypothetical protein BH20ACT6_BH20ACT6_10610 [soil metagenome]